MILFFFCRCEGIFIIQGGKAIISRNEINENNDGIIIMGSHPEISFNTINSGKGNGKNNVHFFFLP